MPVVVCIGGVPNAGKSTIGAGLACSYPHTTFIDGDFVLSEAEERDADSLPLEQKWSRRTDKIVSVILEKISKDQNVIIAWPLLEKGYRTIKNSLPEGINFFYIFLNPDLNTLSQNRTTRPLAEWDRDRGFEMHTQNYANQPFCDYTVDTSNQLPFDTVQEIRRKFLDKVF